MGTASLLESVRITYPPWLAHKLSCVADHVLRCTFALAAVLKVHSTLLANLHGADHQLAYWGCLHTRVPGCPHLHKRVSPADGGLAIEAMHLVPN
jgi:hypothetical protein